MIERGKQIWKNGNRRFRFTYWNRRYIGFNFMFYELRTVSGVEICGVSLDLGWFSVFFGV